jgi:hypothetical protein
MEYAYDFSGYCRSIGRGRADNVADKHVYSDGGGIKSILNIVVFLVVAVWLLQGFGIIGNIPGVRIPALR